MYLVGILEFNRQPDDGNRVGIPDESLYDPPSNEEPRLELTLDHVALMSGDLAASRDAYQDLGFTLSPMSVHKGRITPDGPVVQWGSGNHCAMFERGYLEILGVVDPNRYYEPFRAALTRFHGVSLIALGCEDARAFYERAPALRQSPVEIRRDVPVGVSGDGTREAVFHIVRLESDAFPEADLLFIEHGTKDVLWQPHLVGHANGALALSGITLSSDEPEETAARFERCTGLGGTAVDGGPHFTLEQSYVKISKPDEIVSRYPGAVLPAVPSVGVVQLLVRDLDETKRCLEASGVTAHACAEGIWIRPERTGGVILELTT